VGDRLDEFVLRDTVFDCTAEVEVELTGVTAGRENGDRDEAAVACGQLGSVPHVGEKHVVGEFSELRGEVAEHVPTTSCLSGLFGHGCPFVRRWRERRWSRARSRTSRSQGREKR
jgi:hypothetical protein